MISQITLKKVVGRSNPVSRRLSKLWRIKMDAKINGPSFSAFFQLFSGKIIYDSFNLISHQNYLPTGKI